MNKMTEIQNVKPIDAKITALMIEGYNQTQISEKLNISRGTVARRLDQNSSIIEALQLAGIDNNYLAKKAKELLESKRKLYNPKTQEFEDVPDNNARNTAFSTTCKLAGHLRDNPENTQNIQVNIVQYGDKPVDNSEIITVDNSESL